jgi:hypothetical protein
MARRISCFKIYQQWELTPNGNESCAGLSALKNGLAGHCAGLSVAWHGRLETREADRGAPRLVTPDSVAILQQQKLALPRFGGQVLGDCVS